MHALYSMRNKLTVILLLAGITSFAQKNGNSLATVWKKQVARVIDMQEPEDTIVHHLRDAGNNTTLTEMMVNAIKTGNVAAYSNYDNTFSTKLTIAQINEMTSSKLDTVVMTDPVTGKEVMKIISRDMNYDLIHKFRLLEDWTFNPGTGKTEIQIVGIAPIREIYGEDGSFRGVQAMFWLHYNDALPIISHYEQYHPNNTIAEHIWNDYFLSEVKPSEVK